MNHFKRQSEKLRQKYTVQRPKVPGRHGALSESGKKRVSCGLQKAPSLCDGTSVVFISHLSDFTKAIVFGSQPIATEEGEDLGEDLAGFVLSQMHLWTQARRAWSHTDFRKVDHGQASI